MIKLDKIEKTEELIDSRILGSRMSLECVASVLQRQKLMANGLNKPKQKVWYVRYAILETVIERGCGKRSS